MNYFLIFIIRIYQLYFPKKYRGCCLYRESCSNFVLRVTQNNGFIAGLKAFKYRWENCRSNYYLVKKEGYFLLITNDKRIIEEKDINQKIYKNINA